MNNFFKDFNLERMMIWSKNKVIYLVFIDVLMLASTLFAQSLDSAKVVTPRDSVFALLDTTETCTSKFGIDTTKWNDCVNMELFWRDRYCTYKKGKLNGPQWSYFEDENGGNYSFIVFFNGKFQYEILYASNGYINSIFDENFREIYYRGQIEPFTGRDSTFIKNTLVSSTYYKKGIKDGCEYTYFPNGEIEYERLYKKGLQNGPEIHYRKDGQVLWEAMYKKGKIVGTTKQYYDDGSKEEKGSIHWIHPHVNGNIDGIVKGYYPNGQLWITQTYKNGKQEGKQIEYSAKTGKVISTAIFKNDELVGDKKCVDGRFGSNDLDCTPLNE